MDKEFLKNFSTEAQQQRAENNAKVTKLIKRYKAELKTGNYKFSPKWQTDKSRIDFSIIKEVNAKDYPTEGYVILWTSIENLFAHMSRPFRNAYVAEELWQNHLPDRIAKALSFWEDGKEMIPPILNLTEGDKKEILPFDGKHRIAICNYFNVDKIPVIISNSILESFPKAFLENTIEAV